MDHGNKKRYGWLVCMASELLWLAYAIVTSQYGFALVAPLFFAGHVRNWLKWRRPAGK